MSASVTSAAGRFDGEVVDRLDRDLRQHLEHGGVLEFRPRVHRERLDARAAGRIAASPGSPPRQSVLRMRSLTTSACTCSPNCLRMTGSGALPGRKPFRRAVRDSCFRRCSTSLSTRCAGHRDFQTPLETAGGRSEKPASIQSSTHTDPRTEIRNHPATLGTLVRKERLELSRVAPPAPKAGASTSSATFARVPRGRADYSSRSKQRSRRVSRASMDPGFDRPRRGTRSSLARHFSAATAPSLAHGSSEREGPYAPFCD